MPLQASKNYGLTLMRSNKGVMKALPRNEDQEKLSRSKSRREKKNSMQSRKQVSPVVRRENAYLHSFEFIIQ